MSIAARLRDGDLTAAPAALNLLESDTAHDRTESARLLRDLAPAALGAEAAGHIIGVTGPPGAGKSTLLSALVAEWRARSQSVAVLAIDPSSRRSGGALLGDRARIAFDPSDPAVFIRSTAAGERFGGIARATRSAAQALAVAFDIVVVETVGVGQSETDVATVADTVAVIVQPGSGDALQFLKSGIMEIPDVLVVSKSDMGEPAKAALRDVTAALRSLGPRENAAVAAAAVLVSAVPPKQGIDTLADALSAHRAELDVTSHRSAGRRANALSDFVVEHGERGLRALGGRREARRWLERQDVALDVAALQAALEERATTETAQ